MPASLQASLAPVWLATDGYVERRAGNDDAKRADAEVDRILEDMFSKTPKGSYIEWYTDLYNLGHPYDSWSTEVMPDVVASGVEARLMRDPSLARLEGRVKRATDNVIYHRSAEEVKKHIEISFSTAKATCRMKTVAWKMFEKSSEARGLPKDVLDMIRVLV